MSGILDTHSLMDNHHGPGTGALGGPPSGLSYKRAVVRPPPAEFSIDVLAPQKFGTGYCYGLRICPLHTDVPDNVSTKTGRTTWTGEYEVWRRWEDCLWFQELLEGEYTVMARLKRRALAAGKGVKKNGVYIQSDGAASFESLPPGPDANTISRDIHDVIPRLTKKGTLFRASQSTIDQRGREFAAMIHALWQEEVPTLIKELRESRLVRDFFGYWRRDSDHDRKRNQRPMSAGNNRTSVASSAFSLYFSSPTMAFQPPSPLADIPPSPALPAFPVSRRSSTEKDQRRYSGGKVSTNYAMSESSASSTSVASSSRGPHTSSVTFAVPDRGTLAVPSPITLHHDEDDAHAEYVNSPLSAPPRVHQWRWSHGSARSPHEDNDTEDVPVLFFQDAKSWPDPLPPDHPHGLQSLPEDDEFIPTSAPPTLAAAFEIEEVPREPLRRPRSKSAADRTNRNCLVFEAEQARSSSVVDSLSNFAGLLLDGPSSPPSGNPPPSSFRPERGPRSTGSTASSSSRARSSYGDFSDGSSWRASCMSDMSMTSFASSFQRDSCPDLDRALARTPYGGHYPRSSITTINSVPSDTAGDPVLPRHISPKQSRKSLRRSLSVGSRHVPSILSEFWSEQKEEFVDSYFDDTSSVSHVVGQPSTPPRDPPQKSFSVMISTPERFPKPFQNRPPGQFHLPWSPPPHSAPPRPHTPPPAPPQFSPTSRSAVLASPGSAYAPDTVTIKAIWEELIVLLRVGLAEPLADVRERLREKFAKQEGVRLSAAFLIAHAPPAPSPKEGDAPRGRPRANSASAAGALNGVTARYVRTEAEWEDVVGRHVEGGGGKLALRLYDATAF